MNRGAFTCLVAVAAALTLAFLTGCGSSSKSTTTPPPTITITASSGASQSAAVGTAFASALVANVTTNGTATSGATVTFAAPSTGASCALSATSATTDANGNATVTCTANSASGAYNVTASTSGATSSARFSLTNDALVSNNYVFYASGWDSNSVNGGPNYYAIVGVVTIDGDGNVLGGEQNYNDAFGVTSGNGTGTPDAISAANGALVTDPNTGIGALTLATNNSLVGNNGVETFAVQFVNSNHALITEFDSAATSSGSLDLQTATNAPGNFAFTLSGVDAANYASVAYGGVFSISNGQLSGTIDVNDAGTVVIGSALSATSSSPDAFGAGTITGVTDPATGMALTLNYFVVGPEVVRIIDVDAASAAVGSAYGQGTASFTNASLGSSIFGLLGQWSMEYGALGQFTTDGAGTVTSGVGEDNEQGSLTALATPIAGGYSIDSVGYGSMGITSSVTSSGCLQSVCNLQIYMTDPALNLSDPNNSGGSVGGALLLDVDTGLPGGTGFVIPQTDTTTASFTGNYALAWQDFDGAGPTTSCIGCETDMLALGSVSSLALNATWVADNDPFGEWTGISGNSIGDSLSSTVQTDTVNPGRYSMQTLNTIANPLTGTIEGATVDLDADIFQASGGQLYWLEMDNFALFFGPIEQQGSLASMPALKKPGNQPSKQNRQPNKRFR